MENRISLISVFGDQRHHLRGNVAAVIFLPKPLESEKMQRIAADLNQPASSFIWPLDPGNYGVRWYAPDAEIELCGHGAMATIAFLGRDLGQETITLHAKNQELKGKFEGGQNASIILDALDQRRPLDVPPALESALGVAVQEFYETDNKHLVIVDGEESVKNLTPDFQALRELPYFGYVVSAAAQKEDFVSRTFVPKVQQLEDPATGSSHAILTPYWAEKLNKQKMLGRQLSARGGLFHCDLEGRSVRLRGEFQIIACGSLEPPVLGS